MSARQTFRMAAWLLPAAIFTFSGVALAQDKDGIASVDEARAVLAHFARVDAEMAFCANATHDEASYESAHQEWLKRNLYLREMAFDILAYRKTANDDAALTDAARSEVAEAYAETGDIAAACQKAIADIWDGNADIAAIDPELSNLIYTSIQILNAKHPDSTAAPG